MSLGQRSYLESKGRGDHSMNEKRMTEASELRTQPAGQENLAREVTTRIANQVPTTGYRDDYVMCSVVW